MTVFIAAAQLNPTVGDFEGNARRIIEAAHRAAEQGARVMITPELALSGYPPEDLLLRDSFYASSQAALDRILAACAGLALRLVVGAPVRRDGVRRNAAVLMHAGRVLGEYFKRELPNYDVFDERRYFVADDQPLVFEADGLRCGVVVCEDFWFPAAPAAARAAGADLLLVLNASPFHTDKQRLRLDVARAHVSALGMPMVAANLVGGQDELVFDGCSFALTRAGELAAQAAGFTEDLLMVGASGGGARPAELATARLEPVASLEEQVYRALVLGVRDYLGKNGFPGALIGLSGGVDSALVLAIAADALGPERVRAVMMPSRYTADISWIDARDMAARLGVRYDELPIGPVFDAFLGTLADEFTGLAADTTEENIQARIRGTLLMALSNKFGSIVLTTGNKSEMSAGYATLYGDMAGGFAVLKDISKTLVYRLSRWRNRDGIVIPQRIIDRPPSAELRPDQTDQDSLPEYDVLDGIIEAYVEHDRSPAQIVAAGYDPAAVEQTVRLIRLAEYKRRQSPVGIRVTPRGYGKDWRYPITNRYRH